MTDETGAQGADTESKGTSPPDCEEVEASEDWTSNAYYPFESATGNEVRE